jgi:hypothetical protein
VRELDARSANRWKVFASYAFLAGLASLVLFILVNG